MQTASSSEQPASVGQPKSIACTRRIVDDEPCPAAVPVKQARRDNAKSTGYQIVSNSGTTGREILRTYWYLLAAIFYETRDNLRRPLACDRDRPGQQMKGNESAPRALDGMILA